MTIRALFKYVKKNLKGLGAVYQSVVINNASTLLKAY